MTAFITLVTGSVSKPKPADTGSEEPHQRNLKTNSCKNLYLCIEGMVNTINSSQCFTVYIMKVVCADQTVHVETGITQSETQVEGCPSRAEQA